MITAARSYVGAGTIGAGAGAIASIVQAAVGAVLNQTLLPPGHDNNIAPRFINRTARKTGHRSSPVQDWFLGTVFHFAYGMGWGALFGVARKWSRLPSLPLAGLIGGAIYLVAFSSFGAGTKTDTERQPRERPWQKQVSLIAVDLTYALSLAVLYDQLTRGFRRG